MKLGRSEAVFASDAAQRLLVRNDLADIDAIFTKGASAVSRRKERSVWETLLVDENDQPSRVFVKMHWGRRRLWPRMHDLRRGQCFQPLPVREWEGLAIAASLGFHVPERVAVFHEGLFLFRSAVVLREVPPRMSIDEIIRTAAWAHLPKNQWESLLDLMVDALARFHAAGFGWRGVASKHFFPQLQDDGTWKIWLIDCEGVHPRPTQKTFQRSCRKLWLSMQQSGTDQAMLHHLQQRIDRTSTSGLRRAA